MTPAAAGGAGTPAGGGGQVEAAARQVQAAAAGLLDAVRAADSLSGPELAAVLDAGETAPRAVGHALDLAADMVETGEPDGPGDWLALAAAALLGPGTADAVRAARRHLGLPGPGRPDPEPEPTPDPEPAAPAPSWTDACADAAAAVELDPVTDPERAAELRDLVSQSTAGRDWLRLGPDLWDYDIPAEPGGWGDVGAVAQGPDGDLWTGTERQAEAWLWRTYALALLRVTHGQGRVPVVETGSGCIRWLERVAYGESGAGGQVAVIAEAQQAIGGRSLPILPEGPPEGGPTAWLCVRVDDHADGGPVVTVDEWTAGEGGRERARAWLAEGPAYAVDAGSEWDAREREAGG